jgi:hypothetical protein
MKGKKFDAGKTRLELLPWVALEEVGKVVTFGAKKYGDANWKKGMEWSRLMGSSLRHFSLFAQGKDIDDESGLPHLAHLACNALFLLYYWKERRGKDDRKSI